jgi:hypothetical protein
VTAAIRVDRWNWLMAAIATLGCVALVWLGRGMTFFWDEWEFIETRSLGEPNTWFAPHNEHWSTLPILAYRALVETVGLESYVPYLAFVALLHLAVVVTVYRLVRGATDSGPLAVGAGLVVTLFGSGFENLFWGFQIGFVGATALCLWAIVALRTDGSISRRRIAVVVILLTAALATAGVAIAFTAAIMVELLVDARRRHVVPWLLIPIAVWTAWYLAIGRSSAAYHDNSIGLASLFEAPGVVIGGFGSAAGAISGVGPTLGLGVAATLVVASGWRWYRAGRLAPEFVGPIAGVAVLYTVVAVTRGLSDVGIAFNPRLTYESGVLLLVGTAALLGPIRLPNPGTSRLAIMTAAGAVIAISVVFNVRLLIDGRTLFLERADLTRALITVALDPDRPSSVDPNRSLVVVPSPASLQQIVARYGSPLTDGLAPDAVRPIPADTLAEARHWLIEGPPENVTGG